VAPQGRQNTQADAKEVAYTDAVNHGIEQAGNHQGQQHRLEGMGIRSSQRTALSPQSSQDRAQQGHP
jgi:hypothetical protein